MRTATQMISTFWLEDARYRALVSKLEGREEDLQEADYLYQQGVAVDDIALMLKA